MSAGWQTLESDSGVFTYLIEKLGVKDVQFEELITLDPESLQQLSPVYGVIFLFKYPTNEPAARSNNPGQPLDGSFDYTAAENLFFAAQVIQNACGTQAILSVLLNKTSTSSQPTDQASPETIDIGPALTEFKEFTSAFPADIRGEALSNSELIRTVHNSFAKSSPFIDETPHDPRAEQEDVYHFMRVFSLKKVFQSTSNSDTYYSAYTPINGVLYELDGLQPAPISHGQCTFDQFSEKVIPVLQRRIERYPAHEIRFNLLAMTKDLRLTAKERGDQWALENEERKRREWLYENALRQHNFIGFTGQILKGVVASKLKQGGEEGYKKWIDEAKGATKKRMEDKQSRKDRRGDEMDLGA